MRVGARPRKRECCSFIGAHDAQIAMRIRRSFNCTSTILTSNVAPSAWDEFFTGDDALLCALDRVFDKASVFIMRGPSYRGRELDTYSVEAVPQATKVRGMQPKGV